jgi:hypothetical protein
LVAGWAAAVVLGFGVAPALAGCSSSTASYWDWDRCWSGMRLAFAGGAIAGSGFLCVQVIFPALLVPHRDKAPWPREVFGRVLGIFFLLSGAAFLALFALFSPGDELRDVTRRTSGIFPVSIGWLNYNWKWIGLAALDLALVAWAFMGFRHREEAPAGPRRKAKGKEV